MTDPNATELLAARVSGLVQDEPLDVAGAALSLNLAAVIAGYAPVSRPPASAAFAELIRQRVEQLAAAGHHQE